MRRVTLRPEQVLVPGDYDPGSDDLLKFYFRVFERGHGEDLPPVVVCSSTYLSHEERSELYFATARGYLDWLRSHLGAGLIPTREGGSIESMVAKVKAARDKVEGFNLIYANEVIKTIDACVERSRVFEERIKRSAYFLVDGNQSSAAATLTRQPLCGLEIKTDEDLAEVRKMVERGELFNFERSETSMRELYSSFVRSVLVPSGDATDLTTVDEKVGELVSSNILPSHMREKYLRR